MKRITAIALAAVFATTTAPALAQMSDSRLQRPADTGTTDADAVLNDYAMCKSNQSGARKLLATLPSSPEEAEIVEADLGGERIDVCVGTMKLRMDNKQLVFAPADYRGRLARIFLTRDYMNEAKSPIPGNAMASLSARVEAASGYERPIVVGHQLAACLADEYFAPAHAFAIADYGSKDEKSALGQLAPNLGNCLAEGASLDMNKRTLKAYLAEALYHKLTYRTESPS